MRKGRLVVFLALVAFVSGSFRLPAQTEDPEKREKSEKMFETMLVWRIVDELQLSEEQMAKFMVKFREDRDLMKEQRTKKKKMLDELKELVEKKAPAKDLNAKLDGLEKLQAESLDKLKKITADMRKILTPEQQAKFVLAKEKVEQDMMKSLRERMEKRRQERPESFREQRRPLRPFPREPEEGEFR